MVKFDVNCVTFKLLNLDFINENIFAIYFAF